MDIRDYSWHIENLFEQEPNILVVTLYDALEMQKNLTEPPAQSDTTKEHHACKDKYGAYHSIYWGERDGDHRNFDGWSMRFEDFNEQVFFCPFCGTNLDKAKPQ